MAYILIKDSGYTTVKETVEKLLEILADGMPFIEVTEQISISSCGKDSDITPDRYEWKSLIVNRDFIITIN